MKPLEFTLPWPSKKLSSNARNHWGTLARAKKKYRTACYLSLLEQKVRCPLRPPERFDVRLQFTPPTLRDRDRDNLVARMKAGLDGVADALGVNDNRFNSPVVEISPDTVEWGIVRVTLTEGKP